MVLVIFLLLLYSVDQILLKMINIKNLVKNYKKTYSYTDIKNITTIIYQPPKYQVNSWLLQSDTFIKPSS